MFGWVCVRERQFYEGMFGAKIRSPALIAPGHPRGLCIYIYIVQRLHLTAQ
jgi:hypothetical protein